MISSTAIVAVALSSILLPPGQSIDASATPAVTIPTRLVILEVPGITCVGRFTDSLRQNVVAEIDGVHSVQFHYLPEDKTRPELPMDFNNAKEGLIVFGGTGQLTFKVDESFEDKQLFKKLVDSKLYDTRGWVEVKRIPLASNRED